MSLQLPADIWVVIASVGEYSDRREWTVRAFTSEQAAQDFITDRDPKVRQALEDYHREEDRWMADEISYDELAKIQRSLESELDFPGLDVDATNHYYGVKMRYSKVELV